ncbi:MAG: 3-deoxy-8-phosphooctulonate synthase [Planctomycetota bacterium]|nr:3-deoxy-8-phosphooctulonate synthase [Planctomycetota bacterium]
MAKIGGKTRSVVVGGTAIGGDAGLVLVAGPCVIESEKHVRKMAERLVRITGDLGMGFVFKSSYDKANRSSLDSYRGPGLAAGLEILARIKADHGTPVLSDIHAEEEIAPAAAVLDVLQIPAFLSRQTSFLVKAGQSGKPVNIKKAQFMAPWEMKNAVDKVLSTGNADIILTERGACFGYNNLVADMRSLPILRALGLPVLFDATHSVQLPGGKASCSGGDRDMAAVLARAAAAAGIDGIFLETHDDPDHALCDGPNMIPLAELPRLLETLLELDQVRRRHEDAG